MYLTAFGKEQVYFSWYNNTIGSRQSCLWVGHRRGEAGHSYLTLCSLKRPSHPFSLSFLRPLESLAAHPRPIRENKHSSLRKKYCLGMQHSGKEL